MKKNIAKLSVLAIITIALTACWDVPAPEVVFNEADLLGLWAEDNGTNNDTLPVHFVRFTTEQDETGEYKYGREWNEDEEIFEEDLQPYGNGWFKYKLDIPNQLTEIHLMDNGGAYVPKTYKITKLTASQLQYKDDKGNTTYFHKAGK